MRYELMLPHQIGKAIQEHWPVVLPLGVLEYHGEHMGVGMDTLAVIKTLELVEAEMDLVILPPFYYGAASYAVAPPEGTGKRAGRRRRAGAVRRGAVLQPVASWLSQHPCDHPSPDRELRRRHADRPSVQVGGAAGDLPFPREKSGEGWWGDEKMADYYAEHEAGRNPSTGSASIR